LLAIAVVVSLVMLDGVHIRSCGNGYLWFRSYSGSLWKIRKPAQSKVTKTLCPTTRSLAKARHARTKALIRGPPPQAVPGLGRL